MKSNFICKNCGNSISGKFCSNCGEKIYSQKDNSILHLLSEGFHFITHFEGSFFNTLKAIFTKPGKFSLDYCNGIRKKYFKPISFFLMLVILYLLFSIFDGLNMKLHYHVTHPMYGNYARNKAIEVMKLKHLTDFELGEVFKHTSEKLSKFLLFIIIPLMAFFSWMLSFKKRKYYFDNFIFSIEAVSFFILWGFLALPLLIRILNWIYPVNTESSELGLIISHVSLFVIYVIIAAKRFFQFKWWYSIVYALLFTFILTMFIQYIYKLILFFLTMKLI